MKQENMIFRDFDVYSANYTYEEMKVMAVLAQCEDIQGLDYEGVCCIADAIYRQWSKNHYDGNYVWLNFQGFEEDGYIQAYAARIAPQMIELYRQYILEEGV